jgi:hypothetical protein
MTKLVQISRLLRCTSGDPLSPLLFNIVVDMLAILVSSAKEEDQFEGLIPHLVDGGLSILQYVDDTILFLDHDLAKAANLKLLLLTFEHVSGLKINYHKIELFCFGPSEEEETLYLSLFRCQKAASHSSTWASQCIIES